MANALHMNAKAADFTDDHREAVARAKEELHPITYAELEQLIDSTGELMGVPFPRTPNRRTLNLWGREAAARKAIEKGDSVSGAMLRGRSWKILYAALDRAERVTRNRPTEAAEIVAAVAKAARALEPNRTQAKAQSEGRKEGEAMRSPTLERLGIVASDSGSDSSGGRVLPHVSTEQEQDQAEELRPAA